jgi:hypothetical protein
LESFLPLIDLILPDFIIENYLLTHVEKSEERWSVLCVDGRALLRQYRDFHSGFKDWKQRDHAKK